MPSARPARAARQPAVTAKLSCRGTVSRGDRRRGDFRHMLARSSVRRKRAAAPVSRAPVDAEGVVRVVRGMAALAGCDGTETGLIPAHRP